MVNTATRRETGPTVIDVSETTFQQEIIERSQRTPVIIDFWAPWCGPCRTLGPILEKLANEARGAWVLAKINVDENPRLSQAFRVQGIPAVIAVSKGEIVDQFSGVLPESRVREWLMGIVATAPQIIEEDLAAMEQSNPQEAMARYRAAIAQNPGDGEPRVKLARMLLLAGDLAAAETLRGVPAASPHYSLAQAMLPLADFLTLDAAPPDAQGSDASFRTAAQLARDSQYAPAIDSLLDIVARDRAYGNDAARKALLGLFALLGNEDERVVSGRRKLANALF